ncbi:retropepsin-like aspartic protease [Mesorhizobium sp. SB112]|uniref:retropepsin-like aspartic protease n=1 Tax=Mesorhizobium sp. SB112 TaxID=3151853 RepID=UPI003265FB7B
MVNLPVIHLESATTAIDAEKALPFEFVRSHPCVSIGFFFDEKVYSGQPNAINFDTCWALIDTGADHIYVDKRLIEKYRCPVAVGGEKMNVNNQQGAKAYQGSVFVKEEGRIINMWVIADDFVAKAMPFSVVLGRRFLQFCELTWQGPQQKVSLSIGEHSTAY